MAKKLKYLVVDTETATLPFVNEMGLDANDKKKIAVLKSLVYDIGWQVVTRSGDVLARRQFLVAEIFSVPSVFNTAYYKDKRPIYLDMIASGETTIKPWNEVMEIFVSDCNSVDYVGAYNAAFDCRAINFTDLYIKKLYSPNYYEWEEVQKRACLSLINGRDTWSKDEKKDNSFFYFRGEKYKVFDLWGMSCDSLINTVRYKNMCLDHEMVSPSGLYFKSSAESSYRYMKEQYDFDEAHTALDDATIESQLLIRILKRKAVTQGIASFPFQNLGTTTDFIQDRAKKNKIDEKQIRYVIGVMKEKLKSYDKENSFSHRLESCITTLESLLQ